MHTLSHRPNEGSLRFNVEFSPMGSPNFEPGRPTEEAIELSRLVERGLRETKAVDLEALCVLAGRKVSCCLLPALWYVQDVKRALYVAVGYQCVRIIDFLNAKTTKIWSMVHVTIPPHTCVAASIKACPKYTVSAVRDATRTEHLASTPGLLVQRIRQCRSRFQ